MASKNTSFLANVDEKLVSDLLASTDENSKYFSRITDTVVTQYTADLDDVMNSIYSNINQNSSIDDNSLEFFTLKLTNLLYYIGERLEIVGIKADVSKAAKQEIFNRAYLDNQIKDFDKKNKTTVAENTACAEEESKYESVIANIYERTYKIIKFKIDAAQEMVNTLRKIITKHMQDSVLQPSNTQMQAFVNNTRANAFE